jgi:hypothetical protein
MKRDERKVSQVMKDLWKTKERLSLRNLALTPEERRREAQKAMDAYVAYTGKPIVFAGPTPKRKRQAG